MKLSRLFHNFGIENPNLIEFLDVAFTLIVVGLIGWVFYIIAKKYLPRLIHRIAGATRLHWGTWLLDQSFFNRLAGLIVPIILRTGLSSASWHLMWIIDRIIDIWIVVAAGLLITSLMNGINRVYEHIANVKDKPVKIITQVITVVIWCAIVLIIVSIITRERLTVLLGGMTAFAAVLMLVFKDPILGFVAGIQLSSNNMVRLGDWIVVQNGDADGNVTEIGLTTVKIQNWDQTITTIPTYNLVSQPFTNWRGMEESGGRRIKRAVNIDVSSIHYLTENDLDTLRSSELLHDYITRKLAELDAYNAERPSHLDKRRLTNIGTFREYLNLWLSNHPDINQEMTHMVRQLQPGPTGLPLEIYCFSAQQSWIPYENVQANIFDHVYAVMPLFGLKAFEYASAVVSES